MVVYLGWRINISIAQIYMWIWSGMDPAWSGRGGGGGGGGGGMLCQLWYRPPVNLLDYCKVLLDYCKVLLDYCIWIVINCCSQFTIVVPNIFLLNMKNFPCGRKPEKTHDFRQSEPTISKVKGACSDDCSTEAPQSKLSCTVKENSNLLYWRPSHKYGKYNALLLPLVD
jgi:hypothetical protein